MKHLLTRLLFCLAAIFSGIASLSAQQFNWVQGGGTNASFPFYATSCEATRFMCTDANRNVYALSSVGNATVYADTFSGITYGSTANLLITSYNCDGQMRWAKLITSSGGACGAWGIAADSAGHIYIAGEFNNGTTYIGNDTSISGLIDQNQALLQLDTAGHFKWIRYLGNNTIATILDEYGYHSLSLDSSGNPHFFFDARYGFPFTPMLTAHTGTYDLAYDSSGNLLSIKPLQIDSTLLVTGVTIDKQSNKAYARGYRIASLWTFEGGDSSAYNFIAEFDTARNLIWKDTIGSGVSAEGFISGIVPDGLGHLYVSGAGDGYMVYGGTTINYPPGALGGYIAFIMKLDTAGNMGWMKQCNSHYGVGYDGIVLMPGNKVAAGGGFVVAANIGADTIAFSNGAPCVTVLDSSGTLIALQGIYGDGSYNYVYCITSDKVGNLYIGGSVSDTIPDTLIPSYHSVGGPTDFFVLKYGVDCSCTAMPVAAYSYTGTSMVNVTYTGTTTGLDSVVWSFGDGTTGSGLTASHTYTVVGTVDLCVTVYTSCGYDIKCNSITVNCPGPVVSSFTSSSVYSLSFTYTGSTTGLDSVVWSYGDGSSGTGIAPSHIYTAVGTYTVCAMAYTACGNADSCSVVTIPCIAAPTASFTDTGTITRGFTYTGTTAGIDSIVWNYGDGDTSHALNPVHTYTANGTYHVCVTVYTPCGSDSSCGSIVVHGVGIPGISRGSVQVFPNPTMDKLTVTGIISNTDYRLLSVTGVSLQQGVLYAGTNTISIKDYAPGIYILEMTDESGVKNMVRVVKE